MAPSQTAEPLVPSDKQSPTQENKPPIPTGAGAKKAMEAYFAGTNHMEFRQRSSSASRTTRTFSRGATPSRDAANAAPGGVVVEGAIDPDALKNALKKIPSVEKDAIRPTPPRSRSISRCRSPLPDEELLDESLPDFYKVTLKPTERTGSQTRDIRLAGNRLSRDATPTLVGEGGRNRLSSRGATPTGATGASADDSVPEFRRVALRRTPSREQLADDRVHKESTLKKSVVADASTSSSLKTNLSRSGSFTSLTSINKSVLSRRGSTTAADEPEFKGVVLKKTPGSPSSSSSRQGSRAGSPADQTGSRGSHSNEGAASLKKIESSRSRRGSAASSSEATPEFTGLTLKKSTRVQSQESKFQVESVSLKPIPVGEGEEASVASSASAGIRPEEESKASPVVARRREERASSTCRVHRETKFEGGDDEYSDIKSSLDKLKKKEAEAAAAAEAAPRKEALPNDAADAKPIVYRRRKPLSSEEEEAEKVNLKPVNLKKRLSFSSSIECLVKKGAEEVDGESTLTSKRPPFTNLKRVPSFTSSLENIAVKEQGEKVHLSCFSKEMGSNVDLVQVCQDQGEGKHEVKLEFEIEGKQVKKEEEEEEEVVEEWTETTTTTTTTTTTETGETSNGERLAEQEAEEEREDGKLHKLRKAPSIDGLFQRQDVQAAFTFTLPFQKEESTPKLSLEIPNLA